MKGYLLGRTLTPRIDGGVGRGSPLEKWITDEAINAATTKMKITIRRISPTIAGFVKGQLPLLLGIAKSSPSNKRLPCGTVQSHGADTGLGGRRSRPPAGGRSHDNARTEEPTLGSHADP